MISLIFEVPRFLLASLDPWYVNVVYFLAPEISTISDSRLSLKQFVLSPLKVKRS